MAPFVEYLTSMKKLHLMCTARELADDYLESICDFKTKFNKLYFDFGLNMTLKIHIIFHHFYDYFSVRGETLRTKSAEFTESAHSKLRIHEERHGYAVKTKLGTPAHKKNLYRVYHT